MLPNNPDPGVVLIVDDVPENLSLLSDALDEAGHMVLVATDGRSAIDRLGHVSPDVILLDALMPGMDGFETCRRIKSQPATRDIPVIFMTGLADSEHVVRGFDAGGIDYVTKPIRPDEVLARVAAHVRNARLMRHATKAMEAVGMAVVVLNPDIGAAWMTPAAETLLRAAGSLERPPALPGALRAWLAGAPATAAADATDAFDFDCNGLALRARRLGQAGAGQSLLLLEKRGEAAAAAPSLASYRLTQREIEVLMWVARGKTNKDIADILGMSPRTVNKHLEHIYVKLGVETRTAAAAFVVGAAGMPPAGA
jgi:DNA-binding NarL/FixJ family response regulator